MSLGKQYFKLGREIEKLTIILNRNLSVPRIEEYISGIQAIDSEVTTKQLVGLISDYGHLKQIERDYPDLKLEEDHYVSSENFAKLNISCAKF